MNDRKKPLVSCIMPTKNRRVWVKKSIEMFARQTYPNRELIIVDNGSAALDDLLVGVPDVHYAVTKERINLGQHRNLACELARGAYILHWDDDDWQDPERIALQVEALEAHPNADICGTSQALYYQVKTGQARRYKYPQSPSSPTPYILGNTFCYRRRFWLHKPFDSRTTFEDNTFLSSTPQPRVHVLDVDLIVAMVHDQNYSPKNLEHPVWHPVPRIECDRRMQSDRVFYEGFRSAD